MDAKLKAAWIADLRSGRFEQTTGQLRDGKSAYCCLGVLACTVGREDEVINEVGFATTYSTPEDEYMNWYREIEKITGVEAPVFYDMNDSCRLTFREIADWIERYVKEDRA